VRPGKKVASATILSALVLVALPGLAGSRLTSPEQPIDAAAFRIDQVNALADAEGVVIDPLDPAFRSAGFVMAGATFVEPGVGRAIPTKASVSQPDAIAGTAYKPPRYTVSGYATFYDNGTTAMRLPAGTVIVVCGGAGCLERVVNDYGPSAANPERIIDLFRPDFFRICGCPSWSGTSWVTVKVY
jgi:hypothetical protein